MQMNDAAARAAASLTRRSPDRDTLRAVDEALQALKADMARESAGFLARLRNLLVDCEEAADGLRALSGTRHRLRHDL